jgi:CheY-like chemotaxis protein
MRKLKSILMVDDDNSTNFLHELILKNAGCTEHFHFSLNGEEALNYLRQQYQSKGTLPEIIFLDINMPVMNGWEFLEEFALLPAEIRQSVKVVMLTTSVNPDDEERAISIPWVKAFRNKPVSESMIQEIAETCLQDY